MECTLVITVDEKTNTYLATSPDLPDIVIVDTSEVDVMSRFIYAASRHLEELRAAGREVPPRKTKVMTVTV